MRNAYSGLFDVVPMPDPRSDSKTASTAILEAPRGYLGRPDPQGATT